MKLRLAIFTKIKPIDVIYDMEEHNKEGRLITLEFDKYYLINVYVPNAQRGLLRLDYRKKWDNDFLNYMKKQEMILNI